MTYATGAGLVFLAGLVWSVQGLLIRLIQDAGPWEILFWRSAGMVMVLLVLSGMILILRFGSVSSCSGSVIELYLILSRASEELEISSLKKISLLE
jgi:hypothetical protein